MAEQEDIWHAMAPVAHLSAAWPAPARGTLHLVRVLRLPSMHEYSQDESLAKAKKQGMLEANAYLGAVEQLLREGSLAGLKLQVTSSIVVDTDVASAFLRIAEVSEDMESCWTLTEQSSIVCSLGRRIPRPC